MMNIIVGQGEFLHMRNLNTIGRGDRVHAARAWRLVLVATLLFSVSSCVAPDAGQETADGYYLPPTQLGDRPSEDIARDSQRKPFQVLEFLGVQPGMTVLDVIASGGYYSEVLAHAVGEQGLVYAQNPAVVLRFFGGASDRALQARTARVPNLRRLDREFGDIGLPSESIDVAITALNFHDIYNRSPAQAHAVLLAIKHVLKPGGVLGIVDHNSLDGADHAALHRIPEQLVIKAAEEAGFQVSRSPLLANADDDYSLGPFAPTTRGQTDRFVLKLTKPANPA